MIALWLNDIRKNPKEPEPWLRGGHQPCDRKVLSSNDCTYAGVKVWLLRGHKHSGFCILPPSLPMAVSRRDALGMQLARAKWGPMGVLLWLFLRMYLQAHNTDFRLILFRGSLQAVLHNPTSAHHSCLPVSARSRHVVDATQNSLKPTPLNMTLASQ